MNSCRMLNSKSAIEHKAKKPDFITRNQKMEIGSKVTMLNIFILHIWVS